MEKTKIGLSTYILAAIAYLTFLFGGYVAGLLILGYILLVETDETLKVSAVTALIVTLAFSVLNFVVGLLPDIVNIFDSVLNIFDVYINLNFIHNFFNVLYQILSLLKNVALILLAVAAFFKKPVQIPFVKKLFE